jgi:hypothetical protein
MFAVLLGNLVLAAGCATLEKTGVNILQNDAVAH